MAENETKKAGGSVTNEIKTEMQKRKGFWGKFVTFLMMGGFLVILIVGVLIALGISMLVSHP